MFPEKKEQIVEESVNNQKEEEKVDINIDKEEPIQKEEIKEEPQKEIIESRPLQSVKGKKTKKEPRVKPEKEKEEIKSNEIKEDKKESVQELEKEVEQETKEIKSEVEKELKKSSMNNNLEFTTTHQEKFRIDATISKQKTQKEKPETTSSSTKKEFKSPKNYHPSETQNINPFSMFPMFPPMMMPPNTDPKGGQPPFYYMVPVPVDSSHFSSKEYLEYWKNITNNYPIMQNMYQPNFNNQNNNAKK